jgi:hypothetical protein
VFSAKLGSNDLSVRAAVVIAAVSVVLAWLIWDLGVALFVAGGSFVGLLLSELWRALAEPLDERLERYRRTNDDQL